MHVDRVRPAREDHHPGADSEATRVQLTQEDPYVPAIPHRCRSGARLALPLTLAAGPAGAAGSGDPSADPSLASYDGHTIDLDDGSWDGASACASDGRTTRCFDTEAELDAWLAGTPAARRRAVRRRWSGRQRCSPAPARCASTRTAASAAGCSTCRRGGCGSTSRSYGFNNITSSFVVGACTVYLADGTNGGGSWYPGGYANSVVPVLASGWNDRISSVYVV